MQHKHKFEEFKEEGCTDNKRFLLCSCGEYKEVI